MWSPHQRGCALNQSADGPVLRTTQRVGINDNHKRCSSDAYFAVPESVNIRADGVGCSMQIPTSLAPLYRLFALLGGTAVFGCSVVFWNTMLH